MAPCQTNEARYQALFISKPVLLQTRRRDRTATVTLLLLGMLITGASLADGVPGADNRLFGQWQWDKDASDDLEDAFDDKLRRSRSPAPGSARFGNGQRTTVEKAQQNYWDTISKSRQRRASKNLARLGTAYPLISAELLQMEQVEDGIKITYDTDLPRLIRPNPAGRVYSAKGDELVVDTLGHTLSFWEEDALVLETDPPAGGRLVERLKLVAPDRLEYETKLNLFVLTEPITVKRVFRPASATKR